MQFLQKTHRSRAHVRERELSKRSRLIRLDLVWFGLVCICIGTARIGKRANEHITDRFDLLFV